MVGSSISHYKILKKLGEGSMGVVYKAEDTKLDRLVVLKFVSSSICYGRRKTQTCKRHYRASAIGSALRSLLISTPRRLRSVTGRPARTSSSRKVAM